MTILTATLSNRFTQASIATIKRHIQSSQGLCDIKALRLLRRNVRDASPRATRHVQTIVARKVLELIKRGEA